ncbi:hypothetical protein FB45DRAFT_909876 [Roridomyces roridus]|uniref:Mid2 domain-containing protein n=1 Tax=Roridomyces roridus TaxID=1738132 RepID=A0AAD7BZ94_9AGAR|nr:hypothetical protein FB45DRAFT_909876 [Roridomyces roridus]
MAKFYAATLVLAASPLASAYSWSFASAPTQCSNVTISVSGGSPPFSVLIIPYGPSPLPNGLEARKIQDQPFPGSDSSVSFKLNFPQFSQFVAVVSDSTGFGSGGTSVGVEVASSSDTSCFDSSKAVTPDFFYSINPTGVITQCEITRLSWDPSQVQGTPKFQGVIPGGESFEIPQAQITTVEAEGTGFNWTAPLRSMTNVILVGGDNRGNGTGGSTLYIVGGGTENDSSCLNSTSPSSTAGAPAGGSYQTGTGSFTGSSPTNSGSSSGSSGGSSTNVGAIAGGVVGGVVALIAALLVALFWMRRRRLRKTEKVRPDLLPGEEEDDEDVGTTPGGGLPQYYQPEPFMVTDPTAGRASAEGFLSEGNRTSTFSESRSGTPDPTTTMSTATRKSAPMRQMRPVNIIQHADAGPSSPPGDEEPETVELPPAYNNIRKGPIPESAPTAPTETPAVAPTETATEA